MGGERPFDAEAEDWVMVTATRFFFEPYCTEFEPAGPGQIVILFGDNGTRHRGVEVSMCEDGTAAVWIPAHGRMFWLPEWSPGDAPARWEERLREFNYLSGTWATSSLSDDEPVDPPVPATRTPD